MIDDHDIARLDELYVHKDDCQDIQNYENHSGVDGYFTSHKSTAICWSYQKAEGITKKRAAPLLVLPFSFLFYFIPAVGIIQSPFFIKEK